LQFRTPFERCFSFLSHVHLRPFSFILNPNAVKCLHTFEIQNTDNVVAMDETAIYDYSWVRICLNANIPTFHGILLLRSLPRTRKITYFFFTSFLFDKIMLICYKIPHYQCGFCAVSEKWYFLVYGAVFRDFSKSTLMVFHII
jgi:hypothetical protein